MKIRYKAILGPAMALAVALGAVTLYVFWPQPALAPNSAPPSPHAFNKANIERGARIVALGDCMVCHTAKNGAAYAGGYPLKTPFGTIFSTNITPDPETGIGQWSYQAFERALRQGVARDGHLLYPAFPYTHYTQMTDGDIRAAYDYLMSRTPVRATAPANELIFPLGFRPMLAGWNLLFLRPGNRIGADQQQSPVLRGQYLVDSMGHCASCHSGLNLIGGEKSPPFGGGVVDDWEAPSLRNLSTAAVPWTREDLVDYLQRGMSRAHGAAKGPMQPVVSHLAEVPESEVRAIVAYLDTIQLQGRLGGGHGAPPSAPPTSAVASGATLEQRRQGAALFNAACAACHGASAPMRVVGGYPDLKLSPATSGDNPANFLQTVLAGVPLAKHPTAVYMPAFGATLSDAQIASIAVYVRADIAARPPWPQLDQAILSLRKEQTP